MKYVFLYDGAIGDSLVGIHVGRTLSENVSGAVLELISTRENIFVRDLCKDLHFIRYRVLDKKDIRSWFALVALMAQRHSSIALEPIAYPITRWWRLILWCARRTAGSQDLRFQWKGYERPVPQGVKRVIYDCEQEGLFDIPKTVLETWGIEARILSRPSLPHHTPLRRARPYILFHFFASSLDRSIPEDHARKLLVAARSVYPKHDIVLTCSAKEFPRAERMTAGIHGTSIEPGKPAQELMNLLTGADLVVGTTSGIVLTAACLERPAVALHCMMHKKAFMPDFPPGTTVLWAKDECRCRPGDGSACSYKTDDGTTFFRCLYFITTEDILSAMEQKLPQDI